MSADLIRITREGHRVRITVDGLEIPAAAIDRDSVRLPIRPDERPSVQITLIASTVDVLNTLKDEESHGTSDPS
ncbi:hypothetical protein ACWEFL_15730 [Streptomyces sp. NPDC004838]